MKLGADNVSKVINKWKRAICYYSRAFTAIPAPCMFFCLLAKEVLLQQAIVNLEHK